MVYVNDKYSVVKKIKKNDGVLQHIIPEEELFQKLSDIHVNCGHGCRDKMLSIIHQNSSIPRPCVEMFIQACKTCQIKRNKSVSNIEIKPALYFHETRGELT